ncbi:uncharacterized protein LOC130736850 [Lotus japonicus]|uniref:uncharacterized protein LOC130736850 n=1 Tax=Lotus japonicus TaxID=34305 RepID=UPI00258B73A8|nr:uncharacterized protein LOC130736850 [Lotus japonicus]
MKILSWNCRGLGNLQTVRVLKKLIHSKDPDVVFLMETKLYTSEALQHIGRGNSRAGGLCLWWRSDLQLEIINASLHHILCTILHPDEAIPMTMVGLYGHPEEGRKIETWNLIKNLMPQDPRACVVIGDFNDILSPFDKLGGDPPDLGHIQWVNQMCGDCGLFEVEFSGKRFTWSNNRTAPGTIEERHDLALVNDEWTALWPATTIVHFQRRQSDHSPILLTCGTSRGRKELKRTRMFRFEELWLQEGVECAEVVTESWCTGGTYFLARIAAVSSALDGWGRSKFGNLPRKIADQQALLQNLQEKIQTEQVRLATSEASKELDNLLEQEEIWWGQRSRATWLKHGDKNSKFFHQKASQRRKRNMIEQLRDDRGRKFEEDKDISRVLMDYFTNLFATSHPSGVEEVTSLVAGRLSTAHLTILSEPFSKEEVEEALFQMHPTKAPGIINHTLLVLIPKIKKAEHANQYRPISLCNVIFKIVTKTIANRLKLILPDLISENQSAFVPGRLITDNALIAYECFHYMKKKITGRNGTMALKLDMSKAYDRIEWSFLEAVLKQMGFPASWVSLIMKCVTSVSFSIMLNGNPQPTFEPHRGLRQGDPLSPYLFILCGEVFSALIEKSILSSDLTGLKISRHAHAISHLLFADDSVLFARARVEEALCLKKILTIYERASGQMINLDKSMLSISRNVPDNCFHELKQLLNVKAVESYDKYLGLPTIFGKSKSRIFHFVKDRVWKNLKGWKEKFLSRAGREVLIKSVVQAIPSYVMSCFILPDDLCADIDRMVSKFFWGGDPSRQGLHWTKWETLCKSKTDGGLGFRDFKPFNLALVEKNWWRIYTKPESLLARIFKAVYFNNCDLRLAKKGFRPSYAWSSIMKISWIFESGGMWRIGDGTKVNLWTDKWFPSGSSPIYRQDLAVELALSKVANLINHEQHSWKRDLIEHVFSPSTAEEIISIPLSINGGPDVLFWPTDSRGQYTSKAGYNFLMNQASRAAPSSSSSVLFTAGFWKGFWASTTLPRCKEVSWRAVSGYLPLRAKLFRCHVDVDPGCNMCAEENETEEHLFMHCPAARQVWFASPLSLRVDNFLTFADFWRHIHELHDSEAMALVQTTIYMMWEARNHHQFRQRPSSTELILRRVASVQAEVRVGASTPATIERNVAWRGPARGTYKCNFDASFVDGGVAGLGMVVRNHRGEVMASACSYPVHVTTPLLAKAMAMRWSLQLAVDLGFRRISLETDCLQTKPNLYF